MRRRARPSSSSASVRKKASEENHQEVEDEEADKMLTSNLDQYCHVSGFCKRAATENCASLMDTLMETLNIEINQSTLKNIFTCYVEEFRRALYNEVSKRVGIEESEKCNDQDYLNLTFDADEYSSKHSGHNGKSLAAKASKITKRAKKACDFLSSTTSSSSTNQAATSAAGDNQQGSSSQSTNVLPLNVKTAKNQTVDVYAASLKEGTIEWTKPELALEAVHGTWKKSRLRCLSLSAGPLIEISPKQSNGGGTPLWGCFAIQIEAVRSTSRLEIPDEELAFVIKTHEGSEILLRASNPEEKGEWISLLRRLCSLDNPRHGLTDDYENQSSHGRHSNVNGIGDPPIQDHGRNHFT